MFTTSFDYKWIAWSCGNHDFTVKIFTSCDTMLRIFSMVVHAALNAKANDFVFSHMRFFTKSYKHVWGKCWYSGCFCFVYTFTVSLHCPYFKKSYHHMQASWLCSAQCAHILTTLTTWTKNGFCLCFSLLNHGWLCSQNLLFFFNKQWIFYM